MILLVPRRLRLVSTFVALCTFLYDVVGASSAAHALDPVPVPAPAAVAEASVLRMGDRMPAPHAFFLDASTLIIGHSGGLRYEYQPILGLAFSLGGGVAIRDGFHPEPDEFAAGAQVMVHGIFRRSRPSGFELSAGLAVVERRTRNAGEESRPPRWDLTPALFAGYRHQPSTGGLVGRIGLGWSYGIAPGVTGSIGYSF